MADATSDYFESFTSIAGKWTTYAAFGSFLLYLLGYLTLRFQLNTYGVATNLDVFDEKYLFAGCRFLVYLGMALPNLLLIIAVAASLLAIPFRMLDASLRQRPWQAMRNWLSRTYRAQLLGCAVALIMIQFLLRQCLFLNNLLLADRLPQVWISTVFLAGDTAQGLYFAGLIVGIILTGVLLAYAMNNSTAAGRRVLNAVLVILFAIECLLLPINYGMIIGSRWLPRVEQLTLNNKLAVGDTAWLVWENKDVLTYFIRDNNGGRRLVTAPRKDSQITIVGNDPIFQVIFTPPRPR